MPDSILSKPPRPAPILTWNIPSDGIAHDCPVVQCGFTVQRLPFAASSYLRITRSKVLCLSSNQNCSAKIENMNLTPLKQKVCIWHHSLLIHIQYSTIVREEQTVI
ncbi:hypothetical protein GDO86_002834 [Hymenochirus boettgeri]|uniref:Uncharacterized protein n=1 Tax=Hymenochirus boettgeri TaxID=247094 RepID=A0A8T2K3X9_9PIPI|nr:hypothetical protein GDO86_002834 [Hymenochirus boettgeri]